MAYLTPEGIARRILSLYETYYNDALDTVEAAWASTEDLTLYDFERREIVSDPGNMLVFKQFPALAISIGQMSEDVGGDQAPQLYANSLPVAGAMRLLPAGIGHARVGGNLAQAHRGDHPFLSGVRPPISSSVLHAASDPARS